MQSGDARPRTPCGRLHIVLVPGFAGFDALGQLEYYAGVTPIFQTWRSSRDDQRRAVLHYFDNFPTAGVTTRAERLLRFLAKRIARGEFAHGDSVALIGHSTGGLDIRRLLWNLADSCETTLRVDGTAEVHTKDLLALIGRVVFLSVPQLGTNIAHWVRENVLGRAVVVAQLRTSVAATQVPLVNRVQDIVSASAGYALDLDLFRAVEDSLREAESRFTQTPTETASAHEAAAQLELWLRHIASDFAAIDDLIPPASPYNNARDAGRLSPAQFTADMRAAEVTSWRDHDIATRSYATIANSPFDFERGKRAPRWNILNPLTWPDLTPRSGHSANTDRTFRYAYRACAGGPFEYPDGHIPIPRALDAATGSDAIELWDNDGIVNTASMLWPSAEDTILVECDHIDIVGHYRLLKAPVECSGRRHTTYDLLKSTPQFERRQFERVWTDIFDFCAESGNRSSGPSSATEDRVASLA